jgi:predicted dehydrogenase
MKKSASESEIYGISGESSKGEMVVPELSYRPPKPRNPALLPIGVIGCGGITQSHLQAYRNGGFHVVAFCDHTLAKAEKRRDEFFPEAAVTTDYKELLKREDIAVIDITTHPAVRTPLIEEALQAGKHVLSQKPFVLDLDTGRRLVQMADHLKLKLAVNQNGRWAPHFSYMSEAIRAGLIGEVSTVDFTLHWDHHWILGTAFEEVNHLVLYDFAIHWFDIATLFFGDRHATKVYAAAQRSRGQRARPPFLAHAAVEFPNGQATLVCNADCAFGQEDRTTVIGTRGTLRSVGPSLTEQRVHLHTSAGSASPDLEGSWFPDGFQGAMGELLCSIEDDREPLNSARENLRSLGLCLAALESAERQEAVEIRIVE